jgi:hypothetical protein
MASALLLRGRCPKDEFGSLLGETREETSGGIDVPIEWHVLC